MNQEQLNAIKERLAKASPGPWRVDRYSDDSDFITDIWFNEYGDHVEVHDKSIKQSVINAQFIAHAREDVPVLVAEVERLHQALEKIMEDQVPIMEGWETTSYEIARKALGIIRWGGFK